MRRKLIGPPETPGRERNEKKQGVDIRCKLRRRKGGCAFAPNAFSPYRFGASGLESKHRQNIKKNVLNLPTDPYFFFSLLLETQVFF